MFYIKNLLAFAIINFILPESAFAYLDPSSGSMVIQIILASIFGFICTCKLWVNKFLSIFKKDKNDK